MTVQVEVQADNTIVLSGELNMQTVPVLLAQMPELLDKASTELCVDLKDISRSDSAGLALLVEWMQLARQEQCTLKFVHLPRQMLDIARVSGLDSILPLAE